MAVRHEKYSTKGSTKGKFCQQTGTEYEHKGPVKLIKRVKIAHSFLQSVSNQFHVIILSLPM